MSPPGTENNVLDELERLREQAGDLPAVRYQTQTTRAYVEGMHDALPELIAAARERDQMEERFRASVTRAMVALMDERKVTLALLENVRALPLEELAAGLDDAIAGLRAMEVPQ